ncbi:MAG: sulfatase-like hydrolase/transferase, partial [Planctomycetota bacterium]
LGRGRDKSIGRDTLLYSAAIDFIRENKDVPFYVNVWGHATHFPVNAPEPFVAKFDDVKVDRDDFASAMYHKFDECVQIGGDLDQSMQQYLGDVYQIDQNVGRLLATLDELELSDNTIVVFSSDHGPAPVILGKQVARKYSNNMLGYAGEFRGGKHSQFEGGIRVPFIVRWPGNVPAGRVDSTSVCSFIDWLPTLASIAGIEDLPEGLDGEDISDIWRGNCRPRVKSLYWKTSAKGSTPAMRKGKWKLHLPRKQRGEPKLYDLDADPSERTDLSDHNPEVLKTLSAELKAWLDTLPSDYAKTKDKRD